VVFQICLGAFNVIWKIPVWLTALHLATATAVLAACVVTTFRLGLAERRPSHQPLLAVAR